MFTAKDYDQALLTPQKIFDLPMEVVETESMTTNQKLKVLKRWEADANDLEVAAERKHDRRRKLALSVKFAGPFMNYASAKASTRRTATTCISSTEEIFQGRSS